MFKTYEYMVEALECNYNLNKAKSKSNLRPQTTLKTINKAIKAIKAFKTIKLIQTP